VSVTNANKAITPALSCAILAIALVVHAAIGIRSFINSPGKRDDFNRYYEIASTPGRPYVDYQVGTSDRHTPSCSNCWRVSEAAPPSVTSSSL
jgi:hypothetical protein